MNKTKMTHDELISMVMASYTERLKAEEAHRQAIREGRIAAPSNYGTWNISDRD
jgi:hypothetical protein